MPKNKIVRREFFNKILFLSVLFTVVCASNIFAAVASCFGIMDGQTRYGTINGKRWGYYCSDG